MNQGRRRNGERLKALAAQGRVSGVGGPRKPGSFWRIEVTGKAIADALRLFLSVPDGPSAHAIMKDALEMLRLFPDTRPKVAGEEVDLAYEPVRGEIFYRLLIDDESLKGRTLCAFFYPVARATGFRLDPGTIYVVGISRELQASREDVIARIRDRVEALARKIVR